MKTIQHIIDGKETKGNSTETQAVYNPATGEQSARVVLGYTQ